MNAVKNIILTYIPVTKPNENIFWRQFARWCAYFGYRIFYIGNNELNAPNVNNIYLPRILEEIYEILPRYNDQFCNISTLKLIECYNREFMFQKTFSQKGYRALIRLANYYEELLDNLQPEFIITWTQLTPASYIIREIAKMKNIPTYEAERAPLNNYFWIEPKGIFEQSEIWNKYNENNIQLQYIEKGKRIAEDLVSNVYGFRSPNNIIDDSDIKYENELYFIPMDNVFEVGWLPKNHSVSVARFPHHPEPIEFLNRLQEKVEEFRGTLLVRPHPSCSYLQNHGYHNTVQYDLKKILQQADYVLCNYTKVAFPALAMGKTIITFSKNIVACSGVCFYYKTINELSQEIRYIQKSDSYWMKIYNFLGWLAIEHFYTYDCDGGSSILRFLQSIQK